MGKVIYEVNGRKYTFNNVIREAGYLVGYCSKLRKKAWLFDSYFQIIGGDIVFVKQIFAHF